MSKNSIWACCSLGTLLLAGLCPAVVRGESISGTGSLGSYSGTFVYQSTNDTDATLRITLTNTSPAANGGYLTAFVFNNPHDRITGVTYSTTDSDFDLLGGPNFDNSINAAPYGRFDLGAGLGGQFLGGGSPHGGIAVGVSETFTFTLTGSGLNTLNEHSFFDTLSVPPGNGRGHSEGHAQAFVARFKGFNDEGSDKVPGSYHEGPEPGAFVLAAIGIAGLVVYRWRRRR